MQVTTPRAPFRKLFGTNSAASSITFPSSTTTEPSGDGVYALGNTGDEGVFNYVELMFFGAGSDNNTASALVIAWRKAIDPDGSETAIWEPHKLLLLALTLGTNVGVASAVRTNTDRAADTIAATTAFTSAYEIISPADNSPARVKVDVTGCDYLQVLTTTGGSATNVNALAAGF